MGGMGRRIGVSLGAGPILLTLAACDTGRASHAPSKQPDHATRAPTAPQIRIARATGERENGREGAHVSSGALYVSPGVVPTSASNTGKSRTSGTLLNILLTGTFATG